MKIFYTIILSTFILTSLSAQVNRSIMPAPGPSPEINLEEPQQFVLDNGLRVMVVENHKLPRVSMQLAIDNPPIAEGNKAGVTSLAGSLLGNGSLSIPKDEFNEEVDYLGASISFSLRGAYASTLSKYFPRILELMADAAINPNFTEDEFSKEKAKLITNLKAQEKDVSAIASRVQNVLAYGKVHPYGEYITEETINNVTFIDAKQYYTDLFVPENAYLVIIGDVDFDNVKALVSTYFNDWVKASPPSLSYSRPRNTQYTQIDFVDVPNAVQSEIYVQNLVDLEMKDPDYLSAKLANRILGASGAGRFHQNLREDKAYTYAAYSQLSDDKYAPGRFGATASVRNVVTDSAVVEFLKEFNRIVKEPVTEKELENVKAEYIGSFVMALEKPSTIARYALNIETENLPKDFYKTYLERIDAITIEDVEKAAKKYFKVNNARIVIVGKGSEVVENLEKITYNGKALPVNYYDKYGNPVAKPNYDVILPEGVTIKSVVDHYLEAVGGREEVANITSYLLNAEAQTQGMTLELNVKKTNKDQFMQDIKMMGNSMQKQVVNGDKGYMTAQGQRKDLSTEELAKIKSESSTFPELNYTDQTVSLEGMEMIEGKNAYKLKVSDEKVSYYDAESGLKVKDVTVVQTQGQTIESTVEYKDYKEVSGILFPFLLLQNAGPQTFEFLVKEIKLNEGVTDSDFE
ncbi:M16 family metallopeptidase [Eudoraea chungangensis]|uniref:M16 family metallopeptidase n=1 Tax=Eudoraea chungangensis TaxID=1481905 RepID=UPI0023EB0B12|nr:pitrilysin family protein [Eudoraea chungangensis]